MKIAAIVLFSIFPTVLIAQTVVFSGTADEISWMDLPKGSVWNDYRGVDSCPGTIKCSNGLQIDFDISLMAGESVKPGNSADYVWYREEMTDSGLASSFSSHFRV